jgi:hypothetical protein
MDLKFEVNSDHLFSPFVLLNYGGLSEGLDTFLGIEVSFMSLDARPHGMKIHKFENISRALQSPILIPLVEKRASIRPH